MRAQLADAFRAAPARDRRGADLRSTARANGCCASQPVDALDKGAEVECVYIPESDRGTLCVSSAGRLHAQLQLLPHRHAAARAQSHDATKSSAQLLVARAAARRFSRTRERPTDGLVPSGEGVRAVSNIVFMGMGEPLYNLDNVMAAIEIMADGDGLSLSKRRITVSTSGVVPQIERLGAECGPALAISLHAVRDELRNELVPLNKKYPIDAAAAGLPRLSRRLATRGASPSNM